MADDPRSNNQPPNQQPPSPGESGEKPSGAPQPPRSPFPRRPSDEEEQAEPTEEELEKSEFLKREEVRTMKKDVAEARQQRSEQQRERIAGEPPSPGDKPSAPEGDKQEPAPEPEQPPAPKPQEPPKPQDRQTPEPEEKERTTPKPGELGTPLNAQESQKKDTPPPSPETPQEQEKRPDRGPREDSRGPKGPQQPPRPGQPPQGPKEPHGRDLPEPPSNFQKMFTRILIGAIILFLIGNAGAFGYWWFFMRGGEDQTAQVPEEQQQEEEQEPEEEQPREEEPQEEEEEPEEEEPQEEPSQLEQFQLTVRDKTISEGNFTPDSPRSINALIINSGFDDSGSDPYDPDAVIQLFRDADLAWHYMIGRDGTVYRMAPDENIAWHAGQSQLPNGQTNVNDVSIGVGILQTRDEGPSREQYFALAKLTAQLQQEYDIPTEHILGHKDVAPSRVDDPWNFDRDRFLTLLNEASSLTE